MKRNRKTQDKQNERVYKSATLDATRKERAKGRALKQDSEKEYKFNKTCQKDSNFDNFDLGFSLFSNGIMML
jgi:hypothetical protein